ncbi:MAG TPA: lipopolysaccharide transport periplasmic protein LptA [Rhizomicrobium sp.]|nr:lipopolysaccharide transport periplasmic protein LptA [Rhizomicrobium sp.]
MKHALVFLISFAALGAAAQAATKTTTSSSKPLLGNHDSNAPITISSDSFQADLNNGKTGTYSGNVVVVQGDTKLRANTVRFTTVHDKIDKIYADGNVVVDSPNSGTATGDRGVYSVVPRTVLLTGNVVLKKGKDVMRGTQATFNMATGQMAVTAGAKTPANPGGRVQSVFMPNSQTQ